MVSKMKMAGPQIDKRRTTFPLLEPVRRDGNGARTRQATSAHCLAVQYARTDIRKHSFAVRVVKGWNRLPDLVKTTTSKYAFKQMLRHIY
jgi:hypothetical protein